MSEITALLHAASAGEAGAFARIAPLMYGEFRRLARSHMRRMGAMTLLDTAGLAHEVWLRLQATEGLAFPDRDHFLSYVSKMMRALAVDAARTRSAQKRGGGLVLVTLPTEPGLPAAADTTAFEDVLRVDAALHALAQADERLARVVEMRYFGGLTDAEIGACLGLTERTVQRDWRKARLFLLDALADPA